MRDVDDATCAIAQALGVVGEWWSLLVVRDLAGGVHRFDALQASLGISRRVLTERLRALEDDGVVERRRYSERPPRFEYHLTVKGQGLLPVLVALQDWGTRFVLGDGSLSGSSAPDSLEAHRVQALVGRRVPALAEDPVTDAAYTVVFCFPGAAPPGSRFYPPGWGEIPGAAGCTLEVTTYRDVYAGFRALDAEVRGVSTQRPDQLAALADHLELPFALVSDEGLELATGLRLPTFRAGGESRLKRLTLVVDRARVVRAVQFPVTDPAGSVGEARALVEELRAADGRDEGATPV